jgi:hypothetical protein
MNTKNWALLGLFLATPIGFLLVLLGNNAGRAQSCSNFWINPQTGVEECLDSIANPSSSTTISSEGLEAAAIRIVAERTGRAASELTVLNSASIAGTLASSFKIADRQGNVYGATVSSSGQAVNSEAMFAASAATVNRSGKINPVLAERLAAAPAGQPIPSIIWFKGPQTSQERPSQTSQSMSAEQITAMQGRVDSARAAAVAPFNQRATRQITAAGGTSVSTDRYEPVVYAALTPAQIRQVAQLPDVLEVYEDSINQSELNIVGPVVGAPTVHARGIRGVGVRVGVIEVGGRAATANPFLSGIVQDPTFACGTPQGHTTGVTGIIRSTASPHRGIAPGVTLRVGGSCSGNSSQLLSRSTAAADWGATALNLSWGSDTGRVLNVNISQASDRFYDGMVINRFRTVVKSAGNNAGGFGTGTGNISSPGLGYNVLTVGNFDDRNTVPPGDDLMAPSSSFRDPISSSGDRNKPEVSAPGTNIISTTTAAPWIGNIGTGTSYSAPVVTGIAALLMQRNSVFASWPEAVKAVLMATATQNIEGAARLSDRDGAGGVQAVRADDVARRVNGNWGVTGYTCSTNANLVLTSPSLVAGARYRAVIAWDTDPNYPSYASRPSADLDLSITNPSGASVATSASFDNTYEIVDFRPTVSGTHRVTVRKFRCDLSPRFLGWSWHRV